MTREEIISGLKFTVDMFLFDPSTGEAYTKPRNDMDKITIDACKGAIKICEAFDKLDDVITKQIDGSDNQVECQTLRWVLDTISEVTTDADMRGEEE